MNGRKESIMPTQRNHTKIAKLPIFGNDNELQKFLETNFTESLKQMIRVTIQTMVKEEMETFRKQFDERLQFNGYYGRDMISSFGKINDVPIPRFRQGADGMQLQSLGVFESEQQKFMKLIEKMHILGISQRKIKHLAADCFGIPVSANRVGVIYRELAEKEAVNVNGIPLTDDYEYLILDGIWETTKGYGWEDNKSVLLCALGIKKDGTRKIIGFSLERGERMDTWTPFVASLRKRGLKGDNLKLMIADDHPAIKAAMDTVYPTVPIQLCIVHKMRNVMGKTKRKNRGAVIGDVKEIFHSQTKEEAMEKAKQVVKKWYMTEPKAMESLRFNLEHCFTYLQFPKEQWRKLRTTNILDREFREFRRRMRVFDNTFQSTESAQRYANTIINYLNDWYPRKQAGYPKI